MVKNILLFLEGTYLVVEWKTKDGRTFQISAIEGQIGYWERFFPKNDLPYRFSVPETRMSQAFENVHGTYILCRVGKRDAVELTRAQLEERIG